MYFNPGFIWSDGGIGRHWGLKIPWLLQPCGFNSRSDYFKIFKERCFYEKGCFAVDFGSGVLGVGWL